MADGLKGSNATAGTTVLEGVGTSTDVNVTVKGKGAGKVSLDDGTLTATATAGAATLNKQQGVITSEALTTAAGADYTLTLTNSKITASSVVLVSLANGTNTTTPIYVRLVTPGSGSVVIVIRNAHGASALNGTIKVAFTVF